MCSNKREVIMLHVGDSGNRIGGSFWNSICNEYDIKEDGKVIASSSKASLSKEAFFEQNSSNQFTARALFFDTDSSSMNLIKAGELKGIVNEKNFFISSNGKAKNFFESYANSNQALKEKISQSVRKLVEECSSLEGFVLTRSVGGNVGSGMGNLVLDLLSEYEKSAIVDFKLYPSVADATKEAALNSVLSTSLALSANTSMSLCVDKGSLHRICSKNLEIAKPAGTDIENLAGHLLSSITSPMRYSGSLNSSLNDMAKSLVPFPRLSQIIPSLTPILSEKKLSSIASDTKSLTNNVFMRDNHYFECVNKNDQENKYLAAYLSYQGTKFDLADLDTSIASLESKLSFAKFCPTRFKISLTPYSPTLIYNQNKMMVKNMNSVLGLINNTMIASTFNDYNQKLDEYIKSGATKKYMEKESTITESKEELGYLVEEYQTYSKDNPDLDDFMGDEFQMVDQA